MTPTATVCRMSRTAKRPRGAYSVKASTHIGLEGTSFTMAESPDLTHFGVFKGLSGTTIDLLEDLLELAGNVGGVAIQNRRVSVPDLTGVVDDDDLDTEVLGALGRIGLGISADVSSLDLLDGDVLHVEADIVAPM